MSNVITFPGVAWKSDFQLGCIKEVMGKKLVVLQEPELVCGHFPHIWGADWTWYTLIKATNKKDNSLDKH